MTSLHLSFLSIPSAILRRLLPLAAVAAALLPYPPGATAQRFAGADAYYTEFSLNALRRPVFCRPLDSAAGTPRCYAVNYDSLGRPARITRLFFGNLDSYSPWTIIKFEYATLESGSMLVRRTWHNPSGFPIPIGIAYGEDVLYDSTGGLVMITAIDNEAQRVERVNAVTRSIFRPTVDGEYVQEWRYANNRQYTGSETDIWDTQFAPLDRNAWFRRFRTDERGFLLEESPWDLSKKPVPFPGGEMVRRYERDTCGQPLSIRFFDLQGNAMADSSGVARIDFEYDEKGRILSWRSFDLNGEKRGRNDFNGAAVMSRTYRDFDGALIRETFYDAEGNEVEGPEKPEQG